MEICEWCGETGEDEWYTVTLPDGCCSFLICPACVLAGEENGGGTAFCLECGRTAPRAVLARVVTRERLGGWWRRRTEVTHFICKGGCR